VTRGRARAIRECETGKVSVLRVHEVPRCYVLEITGNGLLRGGTYMKIQVLVSTIVFSIKVYMMWVEKVPYDLLEPK
jgi:hypothetical protein